MLMVRLEELTQWGQQFIDKLGWHQGDSKRVAWIPTMRNLRYYTTLGLLDRAAHFKGRTAFYTSKHLLQVLAIKYLQQSDYRLEDIQQMLLGQSEEYLAHMLGLTLPLPPPQSFSQDYSSPPRPTNFWEEVPSKTTVGPDLPENFYQQVISIEPISGIQILINDKQLPSSFPVEKLIQDISKLLHKYSLTSSMPNYKGGNHRECQSNPIINT